MVESEMALLRMRAEEMMVSAPLYIYYDYEYYV